MALSILFVTAMYPHPEQPGYGAFVMQQAEQLRALGHKVDVVHIKGYQSKWTYVRGAIDVLRLTFQGQYDVVHVHYGLTGLSALFRWRTPLVVTLHGTDAMMGSLKPAVSKLVSMLASETVIVSEKMATKFPGVIIPCGVDLRQFKPVPRAEARQKLGLLAEIRYVLFPFDPRRSVKRYDIADAAVCKLQELGVNAELLSVWNVPNGQMPLYYSAADVMLLCSNSEGSPTSIKEALACNLPVVSTDVGDVGLILKGIEGVEICSQSATSLAEALARVLKVNERAPFDGRSSMHRYDQSTTGRALVRVYESVICKRRNKTSHFEATGDRGKAGDGAKE